VGPRPARRGREDDWFIRQHLGAGPPAVKLSSRDLGKILGLLAMMRDPIIAIDRSLSQTYLGQSNEFLLRCIDLAWYFLAEKGFASGMRRATHTQRTKSSRSQVIKSLPFPHGLSLLFL
jgi:hypothetical protein